jgi:hypothetical protein
MALNLLKNLLHGAGIPQFLGLGQPGFKFLLKIAQLLEPLLISVQEEIGEVAFLLEKGGLQFLRRLKGRQIFVDETGEQGIGGPVMPDGHQRARQGGEHQRRQDQENAGPQGKTFHMGSCSVRNHRPFEDRCGNCTPIIVPWQ